MDDVYSDRHLEDRYTAPRQPYQFVVGRVELTRTPTLRTDPPVPGSRLAVVEARVEALERWPVRIDSMRNWIEAVDKRVAQLEEDLQALVKALDRHFTPRHKKKRRA